MMKKIINELILATLFFMVFSAFSIGMYIVFSALGIGYE